MKLFAAALALCASTSFTASASPLTGHWETECTPLKKRHSVKSRLEFATRTFTAKHTLFADSGCKTLNLEVDYAGSYSAHRIHFRWTPSNITLTIRNPEVVSYYNTKAICGFDDWQINQPKNIAGRFCEPNQVPKARTRYSDRAKIERGTLTFESFPEIPQAKPQESDLFTHPLQFKRVRSSDNHPDIPAAEALGEKAWQEFEAGRHEESIKLYSSLKSKYGTVERADHTGSMTFGAFADKMIARNRCKIRNPKADCPL